MPPCRVLACDRPRRLGEDRCELHWRRMLERADIEIKAKENAEAAALAAGDKTIRRCEFETAANRP